MISNIFYIISKDIPIVPNIKKIASEKNKGTERHATDIGASVTDVRSSNFSISNEGSNRYRYLK